MGADDRLDARRPARAWLDCRDVDSAMNSLAAGLRVDRDAIDRRLRQFNEGHFDGSRQDPADQMPQEVLLELGLTAEAARFEGVICFHGTRSADPESFRRRGILPSDEMLDEIWDALGVLSADMCSREHWDEVRRLVEEEEGGGDGGFQYRSKVSDSGTSPSLNGPFSFYVRDCLLNPSRAQHDYLDCPEIVEDIALAFGDTCGLDFDLKAACQRSTSACIVAFRHRPFPLEALGNALWFLFWATRDGNRTPKAVRGTRVQRSCPRT